MQRFHLRLLAVFFHFRLISGMAPADEFVPNYDETQVPDYTLPDPLVDNSGASVTTAAQWPARRAEIVRLFEDHVYGRIPRRAAEANVAVEMLEQRDDALGGSARRMQFDVVMHNQDKHVARIGVLAYLPREDVEVPCFLGLNFRGNQTIHSDPAIRLNKTGQRESAVDRGAAATRWPVEMIVGRGYGVLTAYYGDIDPDVDDFSNGPHPHFYSAGQDQPADEQWGSIAAWAWGLSKIRGAVERHRQLADRIDPQQIAVMGHSRLGKTTLWAGAIDPQFAMVISNDSGCGGAALSRRAYGETVGRINRAFPHWFCDNFNQYNENEAALPVDQHMLLALIAPRPVYVASAEDDRWADPRGEFLACRHADPVYKLLSADGLPADAGTAQHQGPAVGATMSTGRINYHVRPGKHDVTEFDWQAYLNFADRFLRSSDQE